MPHLPTFAHSRGLGTLTTHRGPVPVTFVVSEDGSSQASIGGTPLTPARRARLYRNGVVLGAFGDVGTPDADRRKPYRIGFELYPDETGLYGPATTWQQPGAREGGLFSYWVRLKRKDPASSP